MKLNFLRGVKGSATSKITELKSKFNKQSIRKIAGNISTFSLAVKVGMFSIVMASMPISNIQGINLRAIMAAKAASNVKTTEVALTTDSSIKLNTNSSVLVDSNVPKPVVTPGESNAQKAEREANEQKQKELAEAASRQVVTRESSSSRYAITVPTDAPADKQQTMDLAKNIVTQEFGEENWPAFYQIIDRESGWTVGRKNSSSGACGLGQALPCSKLGNNYGDPEGEIRWALDYMKNRYGSPLEALMFWNSHRWY